MSWRTDWRSEIERWHWGQLLVFWVAVPIAAFAIAVGADALPDRTEPITNVVPCTAADVEMYQQTHSGPANPWGRFYGGPNCPSLTEVGEDGSTRPRHKLLTTTEPHFLGNVLAPAVLVALSLLTPAILLGATWIWFGGRKT